MVTRRMKLPEQTVDNRRLVRRVDALGDITRMLSATDRVAITGPPGIGKSWLLHQLAIYLGVSQGGEVLFGFPTYLA
jgi:ABC-type iron transport system FetAB ATPase subunit